MHPDVVSFQKLDLPGKDARQLKWKSAIMGRLYRNVERVASTSATVFLTGESGCGKEVVARTVHRLSPRSARPFVAVNCGALSPQLLASELFGHEKGSFTGAVRDHRGFFERADGGTLFLDEITEMPPDQQVALLRVLETGRFSRVGGQHEMDTDVRVVAACNRDPAEAVRAGQLREDLYWRLQVFCMQIPPLRERPEDIRPLATHFLAELNQDAGSDKMLSHAALRLLQRYPWPGNVRQLKHTVQHAFILADEVLEPEHFDLARAEASPAEERGSNPGVHVGLSLAEAERRLILATLERHEGSRERTARTLGISLKTLYNRLRQYREYRDQSLH